MNRRPNIVLGTIEGRYTVEIAADPRPLSRYEQSKGVVAERTVYLVCGGSVCWQSVPSRVLANPSNAAEAIFTQLSSRLQLAAMVAAAA